MADITKMKADAIVNPANRHLKHNGGAAKAISTAGGATIARESNAYIKKKGPLSDGGVAVTAAGHLKAKKVFHAVGPVWKGGNQDESEVYRVTVKNCFKAAKQH
jgi:putative ATPase